MIGEIHIKDRFFNNGGSDRLGVADTSFNIAIKVLNKLSWRGSFVLETPIFDDWKDEAKANFTFTRRMIDSITRDCKEYL